MRTREGMYTLIAELEGDVGELDRAGQLNERAWHRIQNGAQDVLDYAALGFTMHSIYGVMENYFLRISKFFENNLPSDAWHKTLVERMSLDIPNVRPALFTARQDQEDVYALLRFRHRFRNLYGEDLNPELVSRLQTRLQGLLQRFPEIHAKFRSNLTAVAEEL